MRSILVVVVMAGCTDPVVDMSLVIPADSAGEDASCIAAVEVRAIGANFAQDPSDYTRSCIVLPHAAATYRELRAQIHGQFALDIPDSGLAGVTLRGFAGPMACEQSDETRADYRDDYTPNLVAYGKGDYVGDAIAIRVVPNLKCATTQVKVRVVDMLGLVTSGSSANCPAAMTYADQQGWAGIGTIVPRLFGKGVDYYGNVSWAPGMNNLVQFDGLMQMAAPGQRSCLALAGVNQTGANTACLVGGASVCAVPGELETAAVDYKLWTQIDHTLQGQFGSVAFGSVWSTGSPKTPVAGATVTVDADHGKVVYIDPPDASGAIHPRADQHGTGPSGLFILYASDIVSAKVDAGGKTRTVMLGSPDYTIGGVMIVVP